MVKFSAIRVTSELSVAFVGREYGETCLHETPIEGNDERQHSQVSRDMPTREHIFHFMWQNVFYHIISWINKFIQIHLKVNKYANNFVYNFELNLEYVSFT